MPPRRQVRGDSPMHEKRRKNRKESPWTAGKPPFERSGVQRWRVCPDMRAPYHEGGPRVPHTRGPCGPGGSPAQACGAARREPVRPPAGRSGELRVQGGRHPWGKTRGHGQQGAADRRPRHAGQGNEPGLGRPVSACCRKTLFLGSFDVCSSAGPVWPRLHLGKPPATPTRRCITSSRTPQAARHRERSGCSGSAAAGRARRGQRGSRLRRTAAGTRSRRAKRASVRHRYPLASQCRRSRSGHARKAAGKLLKIKHLQRKRGATHYRWE